MKLTHSLDAIATAFGRKSFAFRAPTVGIVFRVVDACFVEIAPLVFLELG